MKILVTGAGGLLGYEICQQLLQGDNDIWTVDNYYRSESVPSGSTFLKIDLSDATQLDRLPTDFDYIYHFSAINGTDRFYKIPNKVLQNNIVGDLNIFEFAGKCTKLKRLVYASSSEVVAEDPEQPVPEKVNITINDIHNARWSYRLAKVCSENYLTNSNLPWLIVRYFNVYGERSRDGHFIDDQIRKIQNNEFTIIGSNEYRSYCYVTDAVSATIALACLEIQDIINVGNSELISIAKAADTIAKLLGYSDANWNEISGRPGSTLVRQPKLDKLYSYLSEYNPRTFEQGVAQVLKNRGLV
jgi:UDP-glucose 4-epimerase